VVGGRWLVVSVTNGGVWCVWNQRWCWRARARVPDRPPSPPQYQYGARAGLPWSLVLPALLRAAGCGAGCRYPLQLWSAWRVASYQLC
jgi:hypothetical protein